MNAREIGSIEIIVNPMVCTAGAAVLKQIKLNIKTCSVDFNRSHQDAVPTIVLRLVVVNVEKWSPTDEHTVELEAIYSNIGSRIKLKQAVPEALVNLESNLSGSGRIVGNVQSKHSSIANAAAMVA